MRSITPKAVASSAITVTNTATLLYSLMDTAGSTSQSLKHFTDQGANTVVITPEGGDVRFLCNAVPTASLGTLLKNGAMYSLPGLDLTTMKLIRTGGSNVTCSVQIFAGTGSESGWAAGGAVSDVTAPNYEDGTNGVAAVVHKPLANDTYTWMNDFSTALEKSRAVSADPATVKAVYVRIDASYATDDLWIHVLNAASLPADGAVTHLCAPVKIQHTTGTDSVRILEFGDEGRYASTGLVVCVSTTEFTKTLIGSSVCAFDVEYIA